MAQLRAGTTVGGRDVLQEIDSKLSISGGTVNGNITVNGNLTATKVYGAVFNDYAEYFLKDEELEAGDVVIKNPQGKGYIKSNEKYSKLVVGVVSSNYATCIGGDKGLTPEEQEKKYAPIALAGRVSVKVIGKVKPGDLLVSSELPGVACACDTYIPGTVIGKALGEHDGDEVGMVEMLVMNL